VRWNGVRIRAALESGFKTLLQIITVASLSKAVGGRGTMR